MSARPAAVRAAVVGLGLAAAAACAPRADTAPRRHEVAIRGFVYEPAELAVAPGDTIVWTNHDIVPHTATAADRWDSGSIDVGESWTYVAGAARGRHAYLCTFHPTMTGALVVE